MTDLEWYSPRDILFSRDQMLWLIYWLLVLEDGEWPRNPRETGYTEAVRVQTSPSHKAKFETPAEFFSEVTDRLKTCGDCGEALVHEVQSGLDDYELLSPPAKRALNYISGWRRRQESFKDWLKYQEVRRIQNTLLR